MTNKKTVQKNIDINVRIMNRFPIKHGGCYHSDARFLGGGHFIADITISALIGVRIILNG
jgi:hypothetical protein